MQVAFTSSGKLLLLNGRPQASFGTLTMSYLVPTTQRTVTSCMAEITSLQHILLQAFLDSLHGRIDLVNHSSCGSKDHSKRRVGLAGSRDSEVSVAHDLIYIKAESSRNLSLV